MKHHTFKNKLTLKWYQKTYWETKDKVVCEASVLFKYVKDQELQFNFLVDNPYQMMMAYDFFKINRKYNLCIYYDALDIKCISIYYYDDEKNKKEMTIDVENILYLDKIMIFFSANK